MKSSNDASANRNHRFWSRRNDDVVVEDLLPARVLRADLRVDLVRDLECDVHHILRETVQLGAGGNQLLQRHRISGVVFRLQFDTGIGIAAASTTAL